MTNMTFMTNMAPAYDNQRLFSYSCANLFELLLLFITWQQCHGGVQCLFDLVHCTFKLDLGLSMCGSVFNVNFTHAS